VVPTTLHASNRKRTLSIQLVRPAHRPSRRSVLLAAALELFAAEDPSNVSMTVVARHAQMTSSAVYYHFASKTEIIETLTAGILEELGGFFSTRHGDTELRSWGVDSVGRAVDWIRSEPTAAKFFFVRLATTHDGAEALTQFRRGNASLVQSITETIGSLDSSIPPLETEIMARGLVTLVAETAFTALSGRDTIPRDFRRYQEAAAAIALRILTR
jgi:AcrR family transcriptional regulator